MEETLIQTDSEKLNKPTSRRKFLKLCAILGAALTTTAIASQLTLNRSVGSKTSTNEDYQNPPQWVMMIDLNLCDGCEDQEIPECLSSCAVMHYVPKRFKTSSEPIEPSEPQPWIELFELEDNPLTGFYFLPRPCMHCESPPCLHVCPTGATFRSENGTILIDHRICIGCRMCIASCPYNARSFNWGEPEPWFGTRAEEIAFFKGRGEYTPEFPGPHEKGTVEKCDFCVHSAKTGGLPACVTGCPNGVLYFGDSNQDLVTNGKQKTVKLTSTIRERLGFRLQENLGTKPRVFYLPKKD